MPELGSENFNIATCTGKDLPKIRKIEKISFPYPFNTYLFKHFLKSNPESFLVAKYHNEVVGYLVGKIKDGRGLIASISVHPDYRRYGIGTRLMLESFENFNGRVEEAEIQVRVDNPGAQEFYKGLGFKQLFRIKAYYQDGTDCFVMRKDLNEKPKKRYFGIL